MRGGDPDRAGDVGEDEVAGRPPDGADHDRCPVSDEVVRAVRGRDAGRPDGHARFADEVRLLDPDARDDAHDAEPLDRARLHAAEARRARAAPRVDVLHHRDLRPGGRLEPLVVIEEVEVRGLGIDGRPLARDGVPGDRAELRREAADRLVGVVATDEALHRRARPEQLIGGEALECLEFFGGQAHVDGDHANSSSVSRSRPFTSSIVSRRFTTVARPRSRTTTSGRGKPLNWVDSVSQ